MRKHARIQDDLSEGGQTLTTLFFVVVVFFFFWGGGGRGDQNATIIKPSSARQRNVIQRAIIGTPAKRQLACR